MGIYLFNKIVLLMLRKSKNSMKMSFRQIFAKKFASEHSGDAREVIYSRCIAKDL